MNEACQKKHFQSKAHKRRLKAVLEDPHTQKEAEELGKH